MKMKSRDRGIAMSLFEVLVVIAVLAVLIAMILPTLQRPQRSSRISWCINDLKQIGLAFRVWEGDNNDKYPMSVSITNGGTMELVDSGTVWRHFEVMSNELNTPKVLLCPNDTDPKRTMATAWESTPSASYNVQFTGNSNTSYFVGVDASDTNPKMFLGGDRNLTARSIALSPGLHSMRTNELMGWTKELHVNKGNILMADGSVQEFTPGALQTAWEQTGIATNRLAIP